MMLANGHEDADANDRARTQSNSLTNSINNLKKMKKKIKKKRKSFQKPFCTFPASSTTIQTFAAYSLIINDGGLTGAIMPQIPNLKSTFNHLKKLIENICTVSLFLDGFLKEKSGTATDREVGGRTAFK